jgi:hypothetical protein
MCLCQNYWHLLQLHLHQISTHRHMSPSHCRKIFMCLSRKPLHDFCLPLLPAKRLMQPRLWVWSLKIAWFDVRHLKVRLEGKYSGLQSTFHQPQELNLQLNDSNTKFKKSNRLVSMSLATGGDILFLTERRKWVFQNHPTEYLLHIYIHKRWKNGSRRACGNQPSTVKLWMSCGLRPWRRWPLPSLHTS